MDTELARTFLTVITSGSFISAADRLHCQPIDSQHAHSHARRPTGLHTLCRPGLKLEQSFEEKLVMVSTGPKGRPEPEPGYVYVD